MNTSQVGMSSAQLSDAVSTSVLKKGMDAEKQGAAQLLNAIQTSSVNEASFNQHGVGKSVNILA